MLRAVRATRVSKQTIEKVKHTYQAGKTSRRKSHSVDCNSQETVLQISRLSIAARLFCAQLPGVLTTNENTHDSSRLPDPCSQGEEKMLSFSNEHRQWGRRTALATQTTDWYTDTAVTGSPFATWTRDAKWRFNSELSWTPATQTFSKQHYSVQCHVTASVVNIRNVTNRYSLNPIQFLRFQFSSPHRRFARTCTSSEWVLWVQSSLLDRRARVTDTVTSASPSLSPILSIQHTLISAAVKRDTGVAIYDRAVFSHGD